MLRSVWIGWDQREADAFGIARISLVRRMSDYIPIHTLLTQELRKDGLYRRPTEFRDSATGSEIAWDVISDAPMATEHACSRFLVPYLAKEGWALFCDGDVLFRADVNELFHDLDPAKAVYCVKHHHEPPVGTKMDGQMQVQYARKNWSSVMAFNCDHPANKALTVNLVNSVPGRDLHRFCWLPDDNLIGALDPGWNYLVGASPHCDNVKIVHFTSGVPNMPGYETCEFAGEWFDEMNG